MHTCNDTRIYTPIKVDFGQRTFLGKFEGLNVLRICVYRKVQKSSVSFMKNSVRFHGKGISCCSVNLLVTIWFRSLKEWSKQRNLLGCSKGWSPVGFRCLAGGKQSHSLFPDTWGQRGTCSVCMIWKMPAAVGSD